MTTPRWAPGTLYPTGSLVQPLTSAPPVNAAITNPGFESGSTDWTLGAGMSVVASHAFSGSSSLQATGVVGIVVAVHSAVGVSPGQSITATCMYQQGAASSGRNAGRVFLRWYDSGMVVIGADADGTLISSGSGGAYRQSSVTGVAPAGAAFVAIGGKVNRDSSSSSWFDQFAWNYVSASVPAGLIYKAVQPTIGTSDATEPVWPLTVGLQVVDNTVIWEALIATRITYEASPILLSGNFEPTWPESIGGFVSDNTISWEAVPQQVIQAPQSKVVTIASSKVYAADGDIVRYCATVNPLDWTSEDDAGYLPTGLNQFGSNRTAVLNTYRGNVVAMSASTFGNYQVDPDPANMALLDSMEGIGSTHQHAAHPVSNDLFYLTARGVRTVGIAAGTSNLAAGDAGMPVDPLVQAAAQVADANSVDVLSMYYPGEGQYSIMFPGYPPSELFIFGDFDLAGLDLPVGPFTYSGAGGVKPYTFTLINGTSLPPGLTLQPSGIITGTPTTLGTFTWDVQLTDAWGETAWLTDTAEVVNGPNITGDAPDANIGIFYSFAYTVTVGDSPIDTIEVVSGALPPGLTISNAGVLFGTPTSDGEASYSFTIRITDDNGLFKDLSDTVAMEAYVSAFLPLNTDFSDLTGRVWTQKTVGGVPTLVPTPTADGGGSMQVDTTLNFTSEFGIESTLGSQAFGTGPFCMEGYFYVGAAWITSGNQDISLMDVGSGANYIGVYVRQPQSNGDTTPVMTVEASTGGTQPNLRQALPKQVFYHFALTRDINSDIWLYINGKKSASPINSTLNITSAFTVRIGCGHHWAWSWISNIDNIRITTGWSRYSADFVPPNAPMDYP